MLCAANIHDDFLQGLVKEFCKNNVANYVDSIIITGSFGRNEPTYYILNDNIIYLSDIELGFVFKRRSHINQSLKIGLQIMNSMGLDINIIPLSRSRVIRGLNYNFSFFTPKYMTLFTYDLYFGSKTIYGNDYLKCKLYGRQIDLYEAKRIIGNRICEYSYLKFSENEYILKQWLAKIVLACGTAILVLNNSYCSSYEEQYCRIMRWREYDYNIFELDKTNFFLTYEKAFQFLRKGQHNFCESEATIQAFVSLLNKQLINRKISYSRTKCFSHWLKIKWKTLKLKNFMLLTITNLEDYIYSYAIRYFCNNISEYQNDIIVKLWKKILY